ncbi:hypothetical protein AG0111_0g11743 [Alternaria gaisen]|uniref:Uncharacterized protein n=1 Tax=Alternaria gaisen TaxID=167740 RepID=A0ACB6F6R2_9PLEO|nr:hypothetical protein AG0111_0g11743 [Alternaria gaisen]
MTDPQESAQRRRIVGQGFSSTAINQYESIIMEHVQRLATQLVRRGSDRGSGWSAAQNMSDWGKYPPECFTTSSRINICALGNHFSFDVISDIVFGARHETIGKPDNRYVLGCIDGANIRTSVLFQAAELTFGRVDRYLFPKSIESRNRFTPFVSSLVRTRLQSHDASRNDAFSLLVRAKDPETSEGLSMDAIGGECTTLVMAVIASTLFYLSTHTESYDRVKSELQQAFPTADDVRLGHRLNSCRYLRACIEESLRLSPPVGGAPWRRVVSDGLLVDGQSIPAGCDVGTSVYALHHNSAYFKAPFVFRPSRWLTDSGAQGRESRDIRLAQSAFAPFSIGPRSCLGKGMAYAELTLVLATLLSKYDMRAAEGPMRGIGGGRVGAPWGRHRENEFRLTDHVTSAKTGPYVEFKKS